MPMSMKIGVIDGMKTVPTMAPQAPPSNSVGRKSPPVPPKFIVTPVESDAEQEARCRAPSRSHP